MRIVRSFLFAVVLAPALVSAQEATTQYRVREGDTCGSIARRVYGNSHRYDLIHRANPSLGPMPHNLEAGTVLTLPRAEGPAPADATVTAVRREVASQPPRASSWSRAEVGQALGRGSRVNTEDRSTAELTFRTSSVVSIRERTLVIVYGEGVRDENSSDNARATLRQGSMVSRLSALSGGDPLEVETPSARATLRAGEASLEVDAEGVTRVAVHEGEAATVSRPNGGDAMQVPAGMGTKVQRGRPPARLRRLPSAPRWRDAAPRRFVAVPGHGAIVRAEWSPSPDASRYRVEIARRADGRDLMFATEVSGEVREVELRRIPAGTYFVRLATIDDDRFEGRPGRGIELSVIGADVLAPGASTASVRPPVDPLAALADLDSGLADLDFENLPNTPPEVLQHSRLAFERGVACTTGQQAPEPSVLLPVAGDVVLQCSDGGEPIAALTVRVTTATARVLADGADEPAELERGREGVVRVAIEATDPSGLSISGGPGVEVASVEPHPRGGLRARLRVSDDAPEVALVRVVTRDARELATSTFTTVAATGEAPPAPIAPPEPSRSHALLEGLGLAAFASSVGLRDERRPGSGMHLAVTGQGDGDGDVRLRVSAGLRAAMLEERLRLDVAVPLDVVGSEARSAQRGSRDLFAAVSSLLLDDRELGLGVAAEAGVWIPTASPGGLDRARLQIAVDASLRFFEGRFAVRTRQAGIFDLSDDGSLLWASAYGYDVWIAGPLSVGVELSLVMGREDARDWIAGGLGGGFALDFDAVVISLAGRYGVGDAEILGRGLISAAVRGTYDL